MLRKLVHHADLALFLPQLVELLAQIAFVRCVAIYQAGHLRNRSPILTHSAIDVRYKILTALIILGTNAFSKEWNVTNQNNVRF